MQYEEPLLLVLIVIGADTLAGRELEDLDRERLSPHPLADVRHSRAVAARIGLVVLAIDLKHVGWLHVRILRASES